MPAGRAESFDALVREFPRRFGRGPELGARAPGRVNLIGEHTDYNEGLVLPCAIDRFTYAVAARREDARFRVFSRERDELVSFESADLSRRGQWVDYVQGVVSAFREAGHPVAGLDLAVATELPLESGLSSSAALGVAVATVLAAAGGLDLDALERARLAHRGERDFVGVGCGVMDPFASALGRRGSALRIDCRSDEVTAIALPEVRLLIADSGVPRALAVNAYGERVEECARALAAVRDAGIAPQASALRDLSEEQLPALETAVDPAAFCRARHVVTENARVDAVCAALARGDLAGAGAQLDAGMRSLRRDFEVSTPELDVLCALAGALPGVYGSRLTGAGFGGCTLHLVAPDSAAATAEALAAGFRERFHRTPPILEVSAADGATLLDVP